MVLLIALGLIMFAVLDELHQKFIPGRSYNIKDMLSNITGIVGATVITIILFRTINRNINKLG